MDKYGGYTEIKHIKTDFVDMLDYEFNNLPDDVHKLGIIKEKNGETYLGQCVIRSDEAPIKYGFGRLEQNGYWNHGCWNHKGEKTGFHVEVPTNVELRNIMKTDTVTCADVIKVKYYKNDAVIDRSEETEALKQKWITNSRCLDWGTATRR